MTFRYREYKPPPYVDPLTRQYPSYQPSHVGNPYTFTPYKPKNVGWYGEKPRERKTHYQKPTTTATHADRNQNQWYAGSSSTAQWVAPVMKHTGVQAHVNYKTTMTQTSPLPPINVVPLATGAVVKDNKKRKTAGTQYSPPPVYSTMEDAPTNPTPYHAQSQWVEPTRSPDPFIPIIAPPVNTVHAQPYGIQQQNRLPPEVNAHIEAYNTAHLPGDSMSSVKRMMRFV